MKDFSKIYLLAFLIFADVAAFAGPGDDTGGGDLGGGDPPPAPINTYLILMIGLGLLLAFYSIRKYKKQIN
ncbi:hypothetical protein [Flavobacterium sp. TBRC 19031]|uniref:hypothetical protein n=1 Tax=Flavobacterium mekongense TaxID=3379707 RepID=UPI00399AE988